MKSPQTGSMAWGESYKTYLGDFNGDGLIDLASRDSDSSLEMLYSNRTAASGSMSTTQALDQAAQPDAIAQIRSGNGALIKLSYLSSAQALAGGSTAPADSSYTNLIVAAPIWTVHEVWSSHGVGPATAMRGTRYQYFNLRADPRGRGIQGFESETVKDLLTGDYEVTQFDTTWPRSGMILRKDSYLAGGTRISSLVQTLEPATVPATPLTTPVFPYVKVSAETAYDESGNPLIVSTTRQELPDSYGNFRKLTTTTADPANIVWSTQVTDSSYDNDTSNWILGRLSRATVTHSAAGATDKIKTASFTYYLFGDPSAGLLKTETVEPDKINTSEWLETTYAYDAYGHKSKVTVKGVGRDGGAPRSRITSNGVSLSPGGNTLTTTTTAHLQDDIGASVNHVSIRVLSLLHGGVVSTTDPNGQVVESAYDPFGRKIRQSHTTAGGGEIWSTLEYAAADAYEAPNAIEKIITTDSAGGQGIVYQDLLGRTVRKKTLALNGHWIHEDTDYDEQGRVVTARRPAFDDALGAPINTRYDDRGRIDEIKSPGPDGARLTTQYSYAGLVTTVTDPKGHYRVETRNALGQTVRVEDGSGSAGVDYEYDALGNLAKTTDAIGQITLIAYDGQGRKKTMQDPHMGTWSYQYNSFGELEWQKDAKGQITLIGYDRLGRMISRQDHGDASPSIWTYDTALHGKGKLAWVQGQNQYLQTLQYNAESLPSSVATTLRSTGAAKTFTATMTYDGQNRPWTTTHDSGFTLENVYNERGYLVALRSPMENKLDVYDQSALQARIDEIIALLPTYQTQVTDLTLEVQNFTLAAAELNVEAAELEEALRNDPNQAANWQAIEDARELADTYSGLAAVVQGQIYSAQADADRLRDYADFYIALESTPYTQTLHWQNLLGDRATALDQEATALEETAASYQSSIASLLTSIDTQNTTADTLEAQILEQVNALEGEANDALADAKAARQEREAVSAQVARLESQLAMLLANTSDSDDITWWRADTVDAEGRITQELLGNGLFTRRDYDPDTGHLRSIKTGGSNFSASGTNEADVQDVGYTYDDANNVVSRWDANVEILADYDYDSLDRLVSARISHPDTTLTALNKTLAWEYDKAGNLQARTQNGARRKFTYVADAVATGTRSRLSFVQSVGDLVHDANGSLTQSGTRTFGFNTANQPISLGDGTNSVSYQYGPDRNRLSKLETLSGKTWDTLYVHPGFERTRQTASNGSIVTEDRYALYAGNRLVGTRIKLTTDGVVTRRAEYYHEDALGSVEVITDSIGRILRRYQYDPFGARTDVTALSIYEAGLVRIVEDDPNTALNEKDVFNTLMVKGFTGHEHMDGVWPGCGVTLSHSAVSQTRA